MGSSSEVDWVAVNLLKAQLERIVNRLVDDMQERIETETPQLEQQQAILNERLIELFRQGKPIEGIDEEYWKQVTALRRRILEALWKYRPEIVSLCDELRLRPPYEIVIPESYHGRRAPNKAFLDETKILLWDHDQRMATRNDLHYGLFELLYKPHLVRFLRVLKSHVPLSATTPTQEDETARRRSAEGAGNANRGPNSPAASGKRDAGDSVEAPLEVSCESDPSPTPDAAPEKGIAWRSVPDAAVVVMKTDPAEYDLRNKRHVKDVRKAIYNAVDRGNVKHNGESKRNRRVDLESVLAWWSKRSTRVCDKADGDTDGARSDYYQQILNKEFKDVPVPRELDNRRIF